MKRLIVLLTLPILACGGLADTVSPTITPLTPSTVAPATQTVSPSETDTPTAPSTKTPLPNVNEFPNANNYEWRLIANGLTRPVDIQSAFDGSGRLYIIEKYGIPTCVINGASGGSSIEYNILRNTANPTDFGTAYGRLLYRVQKAGVQHNIKAILWRQGENETSGNAPGYPTNFNTLYNFWKLDILQHKKSMCFR